MSIEMTAHAYAMLDAYVYGFALQEATLPATAGDDMAELAAALVDQFPTALYPHLAEFTTEHVLKPGYDFGNEFDRTAGVVRDVTVDCRLTGLGPELGIDIGGRGHHRIVPFEGLS